jgi:hypothetical protein
VAPPQPPELERALGLVPEIGIVGGPAIGIADTVPGAIIGGVIGWFAADQVRRCPHCGRIFKT